MTEILAFLAALHCVPSAEVVVAPHLQVPGFYKAGVVVLRNMNDEVLVHELWHNCQEQSNGVSQTAEEHLRREQEAQHIGRLWRDR